MKMNNMDKKNEMLALEAAHVNMNKINENKVVVENGKIKTILCEETQQKGMSVEEARRLSHEKVNKLYKLMEQDGNNNPT